MAPPGHDSAPPDRDGPGIDIEDCRGVLVDAEDVHPVGEEIFEDAKATLAHVAVPSVVRAAFGVVVVRHDGSAQPGGAQQIETVEPARRLTHLVHLVHRQRAHAESDRGGAGKGHAATVAELRGEEIRHRRAGPLAERIARASGPGEDVARLGDPREHRLVLEVGRPFATPE